jgi:tripartite-type tricarboxylate transporter receptor subunit TctC
MRLVRYAVLLSVILLSSGYSHAANADLDFYKGKVVNYIVATKPGGGYDMYARLIGKYMQKYLPGATVIVKNMPGAGHIIGANETYLAKPDGLTIGTFITSLIYSQIIGQPGIRFDLVKYSWIGKANTEKRVLIIDKKSPIKNYANLMESKTPVKMVSSGVGAANHQETLLAAEALNLPLKLIPGYMGREGEMAMLRGEVDGQIGSYVSLKPFIMSEGCSMILQFGATKHPEMLKVPLAIEQKASPKGKKLLALMANMAEIWRPTAAPPGVPPGRLEVLREAYKKALTDPAFIKEAEKVGMDLEPGFGEDVAKMVKEAVNQPAENVALLKQIIKVD